MINTPVRILHLEDISADAELVEWQLKKAGLEFEKIVVDNRIDFEKQLYEFLPDIILSDHSLPSFDSVGALKILKAQKINIPFILITATVSEEFAVEIMRLGAQDYLLKDRLHRLPSAILNSIEKVRLEELQRLGLERLTFHLENTPLGFIEWDHELHIKSLSKRAEEIFGWTLEEFIAHGSTGYSQVYEDDRTWVNKIAAQMIAGEIESNKVIHRNLTKDGSVIWCEWFNSVMKDHTGKVITIMSLVQDITERKKTEQQLAINEARLKEAQALAHIGNWEIDLKTNINTWSEEMFRIFGADKEKIIPSPEMFLSFIHPDDFNYAVEKVAEGFRIMQSSSFEFRFIHPDKKIHNGYSEWKFEIDQNNMPIRLFGIVMDITERKQAETERETMISEIINRNKELEQFSYIVSHNLRSPVANILGAAVELTIGGNDSETDAILKKWILDSSERLDGVVKDLNLILQAKHEFNETKETVNFSSIVDDIELSLGQLTDIDNLKISRDFSGIDQLFTVKSYLYSIFFNLISNSLKYRNKETESKLHIQSEIHNGIVIISFSDNGLGIDLERKGDHIFGLYKRFHDHVEGKGIGLFMVKTQVESLGGKISVQSAVNKGTEFKIEFAL
jgi:PAS domain S-box-containing protein